MVKVTSSLFLNFLVLFMLFMLLLLCAILLEIFADINEIKKKCRSCRILTIVKQFGGGRKKNKGTNKSFNCINILWWQCISLCCIVVVTWIFWTSKLITKMCGYLSFLLVRKLLIRLSLNSR